MSQPTTSQIAYFIRRAMDGAENLPLNAQADLHEVAAAIFDAKIEHETRTSATQNNHDLDARDLARSTAAALRLADEHQLRFAQLLNL